MDQWCRHRPRRPALCEVMGWTTGRRPIGAISIAGRAEAAQPPWSFPMTTPTDFLTQHLGSLPIGDVLAAYDAWWQARGLAISAAVDRQGTPWLRMFDALGQRVDEILYPPEYWTMLREGYRAGVV